MPYLTLRDTKSHHPGFNPLLFLDNDERTEVPFAPADLGQTRFVFLLDEYQSLQR